VNLNGDLRVQVLDEANQVLATSQAVSIDSTKQRMELPGLSNFINKPVRFRFHLTRGSLYAFWVTTDSQGASNGFVGAGGPDFSGTRDSSTSH
jgi:hypothetical protein